MSLYQVSVLKKHLKLQEQEKLNKAYKKYVKYFLNPTIQDNIRNSKEEEYQGIFLTELFVNILDYTLKPNANFNLVAEYKNQNNARKADGAILNNDIAIAVIELKGTNTKDLESIRKQAFDYKANQKGCTYVITSNFEKLRFYINDATEFEEFNLFELPKERFELLYLCLQKDNVINNIPLQIKEASIVVEEQITKQFYKDYSLFKRELYRDLVKRNAKRLKSETLLPADATLSQEVLQEQQRLEKNVKLTLFKKSQKLIDRYLFIFFAEDRGLLPPNSTQQILDKWKADLDFGDERPLYDLFKQYFKFLDKGRKGTSSRAEIYAYNGGLFKEDTLLDSLEIDNELLYKYTKQLAGYDFESQVDVNILGHIFENSLNEIESINAEIEGGDFDKQKSKRKKDGVFYTPKYITKYIVENTIGKLCSEKKTELGFKEEEYFKGRKNRNKSTIEKLVTTLDTYRDWLLQLTICDPACGSGAFLNQALDFLIKEHTYIDELKTKVLGGGFQFPDIENTILENNIYGVDLNEESVEIAKLSLWLRTAQPRRKLNDLSSNIKCGNSLIDSKAVAGDKAFNWQTQFPQVFKEKDKKAYHITTAIHDSRTSARMVKYKVRERRDLGTNPYPNVIYFTPEDDLLISQTIADIVKEDNLNLLAYNICADHIHLLLVCDINQIPAIMQKIKGRTSFYHGQDKNKGFDKGLKPLAEREKETKKPLWQQKYSAPKEVTTTEQLYNTIKYIQTNRAKHELPAHTKETQQVINTMCCTEAKAFKTELAGGFDVIIGNPPYVRNEFIDTLSKNYLEKNYSLFTGKSDLYVYFFEKVNNILKEKGLSGFIVSSKYTKTKYGKVLIDFLHKETQINCFIDFQDLDVFSGIVAYPSIIMFKKERIDPNNVFSKLLVVSNDNYEEVQNLFSNAIDVKQSEVFERLGSWSTGSVDDRLFKLIKKLEKQNKRLVELIEKPQVGIKTGANASFIFDKKQIPVEINNSKLLNDYLVGREVKRYRPTNTINKIFFPYQKERNRLELVNEDEYKAEFYFLERDKKLLSKRAIIDKGIISGTKKWYEFQQIKNDFPFDTKYIVYPDISSTVNFTFANNVLLDMTCFGIASDSNSLLGILNSNLIKVYLNTICVKARGGYLRLKSQYILKIPIPNNYLNTELDDFVNDIMLNTLELDNIENKFVKYLQSQFQLEKLSKKLQNWHELEFGDFIKELNKAIKAANKNHNSNNNGLKSIVKPLVATLTKKDEFEWLDLFEENKQKAQELQAQINQTDKEIDAMVYELYGLTEDEITIVENS